MGAKSLLPMRSTSITVDPQTDLLLTLLKDVLDEGNVSEIVRVAITRLAEAELPRLMGRRKTHGAPVAHGAPGAEGATTRTVAPAAGAPHARRRGRPPKVALAERVNGAIRLEGAA